MGIPSHGDIDGEGNLAVPGQALPPCQEHRGTCLRCKTEITVKPRKKFQGEERRQRKTISVKVPNDAEEDGAGLLDEAIELLETKLGYDPHRPKYFTILDAVNLAILHGTD